MLNLSNFGPLFVHYNLIYPTMVLPTLKHIKVYFMNKVEQVV